jgi:choline dehydrogenase-like flavoprotein
MAASDTYDAVMLGSGVAGKSIAWHLGGTGKRVVVVDREAAIDRVSFVVTRCAVMVIHRYEWKTPCWIVAHDLRPLPISSIVRLLPRNISFMTVSYPCWPTACVPKRRICANLRSII